MHHGLLKRIMQIIINLGALLFVNIYLGYFVVVWFMLYMPVTYYVCQSTAWLF